MLDTTPLLRLYACWRRRRLAADPIATQEHVLLGLVHHARDTAFGRDHDFAGAGSVADFQQRVPLRRYDDFWSDYWRDPFPTLTDCTWPGTIPYFAVTSGTTTGVTKYIPCSHDMMRANGRAALDIMVHHATNRPRSRVLGGRSFMLGGSTDLVTQAPGVRSGDLSGIAVSEIPWWARRHYFPSTSLALIADWEEKITRLAPLSLEQDIRAISGTPSWLLIFFDRLADLRPGTPGRLVDLYPNLELVIHGGVNFAPYRARFEALLEGSRAELREVYPASEGFIAVADRGPGDGLRLILDNGLFYEFVPLDELDSPRPTRHWLADAEPGVNYALVLSTCAGAWGYVLGDTVKIVERDPPRVLVTGRVAYTLSAFGEHLIDAEIEQAVAEAAGAIDAAVTDYAVGVVFPDEPGALGGHLYMVEFAETPAPDRLARFAEDLDAALSETNADYREHRAGGFGMKAPEIHAVGPGAFAAWMKSRGQLGGQHKVPRVITDQELFTNLREFVETSVGN